MKTYKEFRKSIGFPVKEKKVEEAIRSEKPLAEQDKEKIALFSNIEKQSVIGLPDVKSIYQIPMILKDEHVDDIVVKHFAIDAKPAPRCPLCQPFQPYRHEKVGAAQCCNWQGNHVRVGAKVRAGSSRNLLLDRIGANCGYRPRARTNLPTTKAT